MEFFFFRIEIMPLKKKYNYYSAQCLALFWLFSTILCPTLCDLMDFNTPGFPVLHYLPELAQTHVHQVSDAIQQSHPLLPFFLPVLTLSQNQGLFQWSTLCQPGGPYYQVAIVGELSASASVFPMNIQADFL